MPIGVQVAHISTFFFLVFVLFLFPSLCPDSVARTPDRGQVHGVLQSYKFVLDTPVVSPYNPPVADKE